MARARLTPRKNAPMAIMISSIRTGLAPAIRLDVVSQTRKNPPPRTATVPTSQITKNTAARKELWDFNELTCEWWNPAYWITESEGRGMWGSWSDKGRRGKIRMTKPE